MLNCEATYRIINADCIVAMQELEPACADLIFADPPYWMRVSGALTRVEGTEYDGCHDQWDNAFASLADYANFTRSWLNEAKRLLKKNGSLWVIGSMQCIYTIGNALQELGFWLVNDVIWWKNNPTPNMLGTRLCNAHETLIWAVRDEKAKFTFNYKTGKELNRESVSDAEYLHGVRKQLGSVWRFSVCSGSERIKDDAGVKLHSTQKPYALLHRIVNICSKRGDLILDPFAGTCTTGAAALNSGRRFIGIDSNAKYCEYGARRLAHCVDANGPVENAIFDQKPPKVTLQDMINQGFLKVGEAFYTRDGEDKARLQANGYLKMPDGALANIHTGAALIKKSKAARLNGFCVWHVMRGGSLIGLDVIRDKARKNDKSDKYERGAKLPGDVKWTKLL